MQWLVTGCSTGLGLDIARAALKAGQKCIATSRNPAKSPEAVEEINSLGGTWAALDVSSQSLESDIQKILNDHGKVDVVVNNAGYGDGGVLESMDLKAARELFDVNFWGPIRLIQALVPSMRERGSGAIVNISSAAYWNPPPGTAIYSASKFAIEGMSEALAVELSSFNIRVVTVQPGGMRTAFFDPKKLKMPALPEAYKGTVTEYVSHVLAELDGTAAQDPKKTAEAIVNEVLKPSSNPPLLRLPLGKESIAGVRKRVEEGTKTANQMESIAAACDF